MPSLDISLHNIATKRNNIPTNSTPSDLARKITRPNRRWFVPAFVRGEQVIWERPVRIRKTSKQPGSYRIAEVPAVVISCGPVNAFIRYEHLNVLHFAHVAHAALRVEKEVRHG